MINNRILASLSIFFLLFSILFGILGWTNNVQAFNSFKHNYTPDDPNLVYQTYFENINLTPTWSNNSKTNKEVIVAVLDSGVDLDHPDLVDNIWTNLAEIPDDGIDNDKNSYIDDINGWDFVNSDNNSQPDLIGDYDFTAVNHGTVVAGVIAAVANNKGIIGIAPQAKIMPLKILDSQGLGNTLVLSQAIDYAVENGADIINLSLVGKVYDDVLKQAIIRAYNKGVMIIAASGNEENLGINLDINPHYPVCDMDNINRVLGVAAVDQNNVMAAFSNYGEKCIDISAPGSSFYSTVLQQANNIKFQKFYSGGWNGTSVAAPVITATAALIKGNFPDLRPYDIYSIITSTAQDLKQANPNHYIDLGSGLVDVGAALNLAANYYDNNIQIVLAPQAGMSPEILLLDTEGNLQTFFSAYATQFTGGVNIAVGDVDGDGQEEIITAPMAGGGPHIRVFNRYGTLLSEFFAYDAKFTGGVNVAVGDVDGDGQEEIITAPMTGGGPHIRVWDNKGSLLSEFFAYDAKFTGGVNVAVGDVTRNSREEIVVAPMSKHRPEIKVFDYKNTKKGTFLAYDVSMTSGVNISVGDVNNDKWPEIITVPAKNAKPKLKLFNMKGRPKGEFIIFSSYLTSGIKILAKDISGDGLEEILSLPSKGASALLRVYDSNGLEKSNLYLRNSKDQNGYNFEILAR